MSELKLHFKDHDTKIKVLDILDEIDDLRKKIAMPFKTDELTKQKLISEFENVNKLIGKLEKYKQELYTSLIFYY